VQPNLAPPNQEANLADIGVASSLQPKEALPVKPSTTTPVASHTPEPDQKPPETTSDPTAQPTPARVMSLTDVQMKQGTITLPAANETAAAQPATPAPPKTEAQTPAGAGNPASKAGGAGTGTGSGQSASKEAEKPATSARASGTAAAKGGSKQDDKKPGDKPGSTAKSAGPGQGDSKPAAAAAIAAAANGAAVAPAQAAAPASGAGSGADSADEPAAERITLPRDGKFGVVVVGSSLEEQYPEIGGIWGGRMAYTVYLHVGLAKSWILQYSLPRSAEAAAAGSVARLDAPWPFEIARPNIDPGAINADALMVHGMVNAAGRFESLAIVFPPDFAQARFVLNTLRQWQFRPATQDGQAAPVEILLIIPDELE
jgi:hypothetical protein